VKQCTANNGISELNRPRLRSLANCAIRPRLLSRRPLAFVSNSSNREEIYLLPYPLSGAPIQISTTDTRIAVLLRWDLP
jgi:hypothetical protein